MILCRKFFRYGAAALFLIFSFLGLPLAFLRFSGEPLPLYGLVNFATLPALAVFALGIIAAFPENLRGIWQNSRLRYLFFAAALLLVVLAGQLLCGRITGENFLGTLFYIAAPLAVAALADEFRKLFIPFAALGALIFLCSGLTSQGFTGLAGNWNWTSGILIALLPGVFMLFAPKKWPWLFFPAAGIFFALFYWFDPVRFPRSALLAAGGAALLMFIRRKLPERRFITVLTVTAAVGTVLFLTFLMLVSLPDTRFQIWRGAAGIIGNNWISGVGAGRLPEVIHQHLYEACFFSEFPAPNIDHAHNDLLNMFAENGIAGVIFYLTAVVTLLSFRGRENCGKLAWWMGAVMLICGCFDQHHLSVAGGMVLALAAGLNIAPLRAERFDVPWICKVCGAIAGGTLMVAALIMMQKQFLASSLLRQGDLAALEKDIPAALENYEHSLEIKYLPLAAYQAAEMHLLFSNRPENAMRLLKNMENRLKLTNFRHQRRLTGWAYFQQKYFPQAVKYFQLESKRSPFSVINANFYRIALRQSEASPVEIAAADRKFLELCSLRQISPQQAAAFTVRDDDVGFKPELRQEYFAEKGMIDPIFAGIFRNIAGCIVLMLAICGMGKLLLKPFGKTDIMIQIACGMVLSGMLALVIPPSILRWLLIVPALPGAWFVFQDLRKNWRQAVVFILIMAPFFAAMLLPPSAWDEQVYQISLLKKYLALDSCAVLMDNPYSAYPSSGQLFLLGGMAPDLWNLPALVLWVLTAVMAAKFRQYAKPYGKVLSAIGLGTILLCPLFWNIIRAFYVETIVLFFGFAGVILLFANWEKKRWQYLFAGVMAGAAAAVKLPGIGVSLMLFILLISDRKKWGVTGYFILGAVLAALPFFLRVWIGCGNPFYPYFSAIFNGGESSLAVEAFHRTLGGNYGVDPFAGIILNLFNPVLFDLDYDGINAGFQQLAAVIIIFAALLKIKCRYNLLCRGALALTAGWLFWNFTAQQTRFLYPLLWAGVFLAVYSAGVFSAKMRQIAGGVLLLAAVLNVVLKYEELQHYFLAPGTLYEARKSPVDFASWVHEEPGYAELVREVEKLNGAKVALLWERRTLYLPENVTVIMPGFQERFTPVAEDAQTLYRQLAAFDYLVVRPPLKDVDKAIEFSPDAVRFNAMLMELLKNGRVVVHRIDSAGQIMILRIVPDTLPTSARASS